MKGATPTPTRASTPSAGHRHGAAPLPSRASGASSFPRSEEAHGVRASGGGRVGHERAGNRGPRRWDIDFRGRRFRGAATDSLGRQKDTKTAASKRALPYAREPQGGRGSALPPERCSRRRGRRRAAVARPRRRHAAHVQRAGREGCAPFRHPVVECHRDGYGCQGMTLHDMSTATSRPWPARRPPTRKVLQVLAGHAKYSTTMDIYTHVDMAQKYRGGGGDGLVISHGEVILSPFCFHLDRGKRSKLSTPLTRVFMVRDTRFELVTPTVSR